MLLAQQQQQRRAQQQRTTTTTTNTTRTTSRTSASSSGASVWWCCTPVAILKWLEIVNLIFPKIILNFIYRFFQLFAIVIVAVLAPILCISPGQYDFIMFAAAFCVCVTALTLIIYFFRLHTGPLVALPWRTMVSSIFVYYFSIKKFKSKKLVSGNRL